ncbi:amidohydrolase family protein [Nocardioides sp. CFH 31398]|uniref:amidohydrolase family protein n=1 Tax=Nocardioides sp. CFH 31398 TaxID=2919579 RepID=UPI001F0689E0|nr:amidohydrolase family protein [Nocardioides sp. CFH 31398]MCH1865003.1 amidohydrolase [Nocardioides sp. CFH 31398]
MHTRGTVDCHQHLWPDALVDALRRRGGRSGGRRGRAPYLDGWTLHLDGEPPYDVDPAAHDLELRAKQDLADGVEVTLVSLSSPLGVEHLHPDEARPLVDAWHTGGLAAHHRRWAAPVLADPDLGDLAATLARADVVGLQVPATALADPAALERLAPRLALAEDAGLPVMVHPGPAPVTTTDGLPGWWPALASYPAQQAAAWFAWHVAGRALLPDLRICFVALAGLAPLHHERLVARGGTFGAVDPGVFYETSSYAARAVDATARVVGVDPLVLGSDAPYAEAFDPRNDPGLGEAFAHALGVANPHRLLTPAPPER